MMDRWLSKAMSEGANFRSYLQLRLEQKKVTTILAIPQETLQLYSSEKAWLFY